MAAEWRRTDIVKRLIEHGADVKAKDKKGRTAQDLAADKEIIELLQAAGGR